MTEKRIQRWVKEGRGQGYGADYLPWLTVRDVPSNGFVHRVVGRKTGRIHHLLSYLEFMVFLYLDMNPMVLDIREQYPLERTATREIADRLGVRHSVYRYSNIPLVMTTDFLVTIMAQRKLRLLARAVKLAEKLSNARTREKLQIEHIYWLERDADWGVVTDRNINPILVENLHRMRFAHSLNQHPDFSVEEGRSLQRRLVELIPRNGRNTYAEFCTAFDRLKGLAQGDTHYLFTNLMLHGVLTMDLLQPWRVDRPLSQFGIQHNAFEAIAQSDE